MQHSTGYIVGFAVTICLVCALFVAGSAVGLRDRQEANVLLDRQKKVLAVAGLMKNGETLPREEIVSTFDTNIQQKVIVLKTGALDANIDAANYDQQKEARDPETSVVAPENRSKIQRLPNHALIFDVVEDGELKAMIFPIEGYGLWGTLYGYIALAPDARTIVGITFYKDKETPGLGGEVNNPRWQALWPGRLAFDDRGNPAIGVKKGPAGSVKEDPYEVDGLSGATLTSRGVTSMVRFWLGKNGFGPYLASYRAQAGA